MALAVGAAAPEPQYGIGTRGHVVRGTLRIPVPWIGTRPVLGGMTNREPLLLLLLLLLPLFTRQRLCGGRDARHPLTFRKGRGCSILLHPCGYGLCVFHKV